MAKVLVFDVNETLLDLKALDPLFQEFFGDSAVRGLWFSQFIHNAFVATITGKYAPFGQIGGAALDMVAARRGVTITLEQKQRVAATIASLPPHPEVLAGLQKLQGAGFRLTALTNSTLEVARTQLKNAGILDLFEQVFSADEVQKLKPAPEPYLMTASRMAIQIDEMQMIAAHAWDIAGALQAGCKAAFIARPGAVLDPLVERPDIVGSDLTEVARLIMEQG